MALSTSLPIQFSAKQVNKSYPNQAQRKAIRNTTFLGRIEARILEYCITNNIYNVTPSELSVKLGIKNKYVWQALNYLIKRGVVAKIARGLYQIDRDKASVLLHLYRKTHQTPKDSDTCCVGRCTSSSDGASSNVVRIHIVARASWSWPEFFKALLYAKHFIDYAIEAVRAFLMRLGFSRSAIRRIVRDVVSDVSRFLQSVKIMQGIHGFRINRRYVKTDGNGSDITMHLSAKEIGIDFINVFASLPKFHVKIYSATMRDVVARPLDSFAT